ncbi:MAG TPA: hypothetical protein VGB84_05895 [Arachidicoccus sp.]
MYKNILIVDSVTQKPLPNVSVNSLDNNFSALSNAYRYIHLPDTLGSVKLLYAGYENKIAALNNNIIRVKPETQNLNNIAVVGHNSQKGNALTGAVAAEDIS